MKKVIYHILPALAIGGAIKAGAGLLGGILGSRKAKKDAEKAEKKRDANVKEGRKNIERERESGFELRKKHGGEREYSGRSGTRGSELRSRSLTPPPSRGRKVTRVTDMVK